MAEAIYDYVLAIGYVWWVVLVFIEGALGIAERLVKNAKLPWRQFQVWTLVLFVVVAPFLAWKDLRSDLELERGKVLALREQRSETQQPRRLSESQRATLVSGLSEVRKCNTSVRHVVGDKESRDYADDFKSVLEKAGWTVTNPSFLVITSNADGVWMFLRDHQIESQCGVVMRRELLKAGIDVTVEKVTAIQNQFDLAIGFQVATP